MRSLMDEIGIHRQADLDLYTALIGGLVNQQLANDPNGDRWRALLPRTRHPVRRRPRPAAQPHPTEEKVKPRTPALDRRTAMRLAATEYGRCAELLQSLDQPDWATPTACPAWDVRQMAAHMLGMVEMAASIREGSRQQRAATVNGNIDVDRMTALQVSERATWSGPAIADRFAARSAKAVRDAG